MRTPHSDPDSTPVAPTPPTAAAAPRLDVVFLGTSAASGMALSPTSAMVLRYGDERILIDCGGRALSQLKRAGIDPASLTGIVITHWHGDHIAGLATLLRAAAPRGTRRTPLKLYGPPPPRSVLTTLGIAGRAVDVDVVTTHGGDVIPLRGGRITAITTDHVIPSLGYAFTENEAPARRIVFSGDTRPVLAVLEAARGADLLVHEATFVSARTPWAHKSGHSTAAQTALLARTAGVGALALTHISARDDRPAILAEARATFPGAILPDDLHVLEVLPARRATMSSSRRRPGWSAIIESMLGIAEPPQAGELAS